MVVRYDKAKESLIVIVSRSRHLRFAPRESKSRLQSDNDAALRRAQILSEMHFRNLRSKAKLVQETEKVSKQLEVRPRRVDFPRRSSNSVSLSSHRSE